MAVGFRLPGAPLTPDRTPAVAGIAAELPPVVLMVVVLDWR